MGNREPSMLLGGLVTAVLIWGIGIFLGWEKIYLGWEKFLGKGVIVDGHIWAHRCQGDDKAEDDEGTYADPNAHLVHTTEYSWYHSMSEIINALISAGLKIDFLHEFPFCEWACCPDMEEGEGRMFRFKDERLKNKLPLTFSIKATKL